MSDLREANFTAWHFLPSDHRLGNGDGRLIVAGKTLFVEGQIEICHHGMRWSRRALDALNYAPGDHVSLVVPIGAILEDEDEGVSQGCKTLWIADAAAVLREFSRWCALSVAHLWDMPPLVRKYLETGDESLCSVTRDLAEAAAWGKASTVASAVIWAVPRIAAMAAAEDAAWGEAMAAVAARDAARDAAWGKAKVAAMAGFAAEDADEDSDEDAAWDSARAAQNAELEKRLMALAP